MLGTRLLSVLFFLAVLVLAACGGSTPTPLPPPVTLAAGGPRPSPSALPPAAPTATLEPMPARIEAATTVAVEIAPGWTRFDSINEVSDLAFAPDGGLWACTGSGLVRWDLDTGTYARYPLWAGRVAPAPDGSFWLDTEYGLCRFDGASCELVPDLPEYLTPILALDVAPGGDLWVGGERGAGRFDGRAWAGYPLDVGVVGLAVSDAGQVWAATPAGVARYQEAEERWLVYAQEQGLPGAQIVAIGARPGGEVWAYVAWEGLYRFDSAAWQPLDDPPGGLIGDIAFSPDGTPWVGTVGSLHYPGGALSTWNGEAWVDVSSGTGLISFRTVAPGSGGLVAAATNLGLAIYEDGGWRMLKDGPTSSHVASVAVTPDGAAWLAFGDESLSTNGSGLSRFDGQSWQYYLGDAEVGALAVAPDGSLWAGVGSGVQRFDGTAWETLARSGEELPVGNVLDIEFAADGSAWVATGLNLIRFDGQAWTPYDKLVHSVVAAPDGAIWVNGWDGAQDSQYIARVDGDEWTTYRIDESFPGAFSVSAVTSDGRVWGIVPERGLAAFDGGAWTECSSWAFYTPAEGFFLGGSSGPAVAPDGALWMSVQHGVASFDPMLVGEEVQGDAPDAAWTLYQDVLEGGRFGPIAFGPGGEVWFGATRFQPPAAGSDSEVP